MTPRVFIDGQHGTTGLRIRELLGSRDDVEIVEIDPALRKDPAARKAVSMQRSWAIYPFPFHPFPNSGGS